MLREEPVDVVVVDEPRRLRPARGGRPRSRSRTSCRPDQGRSSTRGSAARGRRRRRDRRGRCRARRSRACSRARRARRRPAACARRRCPMQRAQVVLGREVHDGVVHEDGVERAPEPERPHVAEDVLAAGVERAAQREHLRREVGERAREALPQVRGVVAAARAELEQRHGLGQLLEDRVPVARRLDRVVRRAPSGGGTRGEVAVEAHGGIIASRREDDHGRVRASAAAMRGSTARRSVLGTLARLIARDVSARRRRRRSPRQDAASRATARERAPPELPLGVDARRRPDRPSSVSA